jgi:hypothetical protein
VSLHDINHSILFYFWNKLYHNDEFKIFYLFIYLEIKYDFAFQGNIIIIYYVLWFITHCTNL